MKFLKDNLIQILIAIAAGFISWGALNARVDGQDKTIAEIKADKEEVRKDISEIKGDIKTLLERTKRL